VGLNILGKGKETRIEIRKRYEKEDRVTFEEKKWETAGNKKRKNMQWEKKGNDEKRKKRDLKPLGQGGGGRQRKPGRLHRRNCGNLFE